MEERLEFHPSRWPGMRLVAAIALGGGLVSAAVILVIYRASEPREALLIAAFGGIASAIPCTAIAIGYVKAGAPGPLILDPEGLRQRVGKQWVQAEWDAVFAVEEVRVQFRTTYAAMAGAWAFVISPYLDTGEQQRFVHYARTRAAGSAEPAVAGPEEITLSVSRGGRTSFVALAVGALALGSFTVAGGPAIGLAALPLGVFFALLAVRPPRLIATPDAISFTWFRQRSVPTQGAAITRELGPRGVQGWRITDGSGTRFTVPPVLLSPKARLDLEPFLRGHGATFGRPPAWQGPGGRDPLRP